VISSRWSPSRTINYREPQSKLDQGLMRLTRGRVMGARSRFHHRDWAAAALPNPGRRSAYQAWKEAA